MPTPTSPARRQPSPGPSVGIDIGGTRIKAVALEPGGRVREEITVPTPPALGENFATVIAPIALRLQSSPHDPVGVVVPGLVDDEHGIARYSANLGFRDVDLPAALAPHLPGRVVGGHDVRAGLVGESRLGAAAGADNVLFVPLGTGIAGALLSPGRVVTGGAWTGEIGHVIAVPDGPLCGCGGRGCLEAIAGAKAVGARWRAESGTDGDARTVATRLADSAVAQRIWADAVEALALVLAPVIATGGVELVLIGGGMSRAGDALLVPLRSALAARLGPVAAPPAVTVAGLGDRAGAIGAALLAAESRDQQPDHSLRRG